VSGQSAATRGNQGARGDFGEEILMALVTGIAIKSEGSNCKTG
jgi:hypothetical protein